MTFDPTNPCLRIQRTSGKEFYDSFSYWTEYRDLATGQRKEIGGGNGLWQ